MLSEEKVRKMYERSVRLYAKTNSDKFLNNLMLLQEVLELSDKDSDELLKKYLTEGE